MNKSAPERNLFMLKGPLSKRGYDWWWHSFTGYDTLNGREKSFFIEYFIINPALGGDVPVLGQLPGKSGAVRPSYVMIKAGAWGEDARQLHSFYPISALKCEEGRLNISVGGSSLTETGMRGSVSVSEEAVMNHPEYMCDSGSMSWDLEISKKVAFNVGYGASVFFRKINAFEMFWHAEGMKTEYKGKVTYNGVEYSIIPEKCYGYADKNWGGDFTSPWVWASSCNQVSRITGKPLSNSVFNIGGGRPKVFGIPFNRKLLIDYFHEGKSYEFNFSKLWTFCRTRFNCYETESEIVWEVDSSTLRHMIEVRCRCPKSEMLLVNYEAPDGQKRHNRLWNGGTGTGTVKLYRKTGGKPELIDDVEFRNLGCEYGEYA
ncbi:MAG: hypothetical protein HGA22_10535 [Clostridiales bacterium]|nr:hypothetical protein [Clostridiales bacterium]